MIVVRIKCGLGNQLFQYAAGLALARRLGGPLFADLGWFDGPNRRRGPRDRRVYLLPALGVDLAPAGPELVASFYPKWSDWLTGRKPFGTLIRPARGELSSAAFAAASGDVCLNGYWQGEPFFAEARAELAGCLLARNPGPVANGWVAALGAPGAAAVHVRRGDFVRAGGSGGLFTMLDRDYYRRALDAVGAASAVVFSDDLPWCREHLEVGRPTVFAGPSPAGTDTTVDQLLAIGRASRVVIANSTFSWWGAWIAAQRGARVVGPAHWFREPRYREWGEQLRVPGWTWL